MRNRILTGFGFVALFMLAITPRAIAQEVSQPLVGQAASAALDVEVFKKAVRPNFTARAVRQGTGSNAAGTWRPVVFAGFVNHSGSAFTVGGGVVKGNVADNEKYAMQFDVAYNSFGDYGELCDLNPVVDDCGAYQLAFSGAFLYMFNRAENGWQPYAGGGIVIIRTSFNYDVTGLPGFDASSTDGGIQVQGGIAKVSDTGKTFGGEVRIQGAGGGGFVLLGRLVF